MTRSDPSVQRAQIEVLSVVEGYFQSIVLFTLLKLKIFERLCQRSKTLYELAEEEGLKRKPFHVY